MSWGAERVRGPGEENKERRSRPVVVRAGSCSSIPQVPELDQYGIGTHAFSGMAAIVRWIALSTRAVIEKRTPARRQAVSTALGLGTAEPDKTPGVVQVYHGAG